MAKGAPPTVLDEATELNGPALDVGKRISWAARMARLDPSNVNGPWSLDALARRAGANSTQLHRLETGKLRAGRLFDEYERCLGRPEGSLRAPIDVMCRTFPALSPVDKDPGSSLTTVQEVSAATGRVSGPAPTGGDWLTWARALAAPGALCMPEEIARELVARLVSELSRATASGYVSRYEALALLRCSGYGHLVVEVARACVEEEHVQVLFDLMSAVGEAASPDAVSWCFNLLDDPRERVVIGAALALENMGQVTSPATFWGPLVDTVVARLDAAEVGSVRWEWLSHLFRLVPKSVAAGATRVPRGPLAPVAHMEDWSRTKANRHWVESQERANAVTHAVGLPDQPLLAREFFEIAFSPHETRAVTTYMLLGSVPFLAEPVSAQMVDLLEHQSDPVLWARVSRRLVGLRRGATSSGVLQRWLTGSDTSDRDRALRMAPHAGIPVPEESLVAAVADGGDSLRAALYSAGLIGHPLLGVWATGTAGLEVTGAARWWLGHGTLVSV